MYKILFLKSSVFYVKLAQERGMNREKLQLKYSAWNCNYIIFSLTSSVGFLV